MTAIAVHHTETNEDRAWDGPAEEAKLDTPITKSVGQGMYAWYDPEGTDDDGDGWPDVKSAYKFPHHFVTDGKPGEASIKGVNAAKQRLSSADIPDLERADVEKHLDAHREDAGLSDVARIAPHTRQPIRVIEGKAKPYERFWVARPANQSGDPAEIDFFGYISEYSWMGDEITPQMFKDDLARVGQGGPITIRIHSGGGDMFAAAAIRAMLVDYPGQITVKIMGLAASAAVAIALAGDEIQIFDTAYMMIHHPGYQLIIGWITADWMRREAENLDLFSEGLINAYAARTGLDRAKLTQMMDAETWMTAQQAADLGFADKVIIGGPPPASLAASTLQGFAHVPAALIQAINSGQAPADKQPPAHSAQMQVHRAQLEAAQNKHQGGIIMSSYLRTLLSQREEMLAQAQAIIDKAEAETRELNADEQAAFDAIMGAGDTTGELAALDAEIEKAMRDREKLRAAAGKKFVVAGKIEKPEEGKAKVMKRVEFEKLTPAAQAEFIKADGKIED